VERGVAEYCVEFAFECQPLAVHDIRFEAQIFRRLHLCRAAVDAHNAASHRNKPCCKHAITAAQIQNSLTRLRIEQLQHWCPKVGYESSVLRILLWVPRLGRSISCAGHAVYQPFRLRSSVMCAV
jgi:hypothetical protein